MTKLVRLKNRKMIPIALIAAALIALPTAASVYAQTADDTTEEEITQTKQTDPDSQTTLVEIEEPTVNEETPSPSPSPMPTEDETPVTPALTVVTLAQAQVIAETEHPDSVVIKAMQKTLAGEKVYKFMFDDGWKIYVRASDGTVVKVQDKGGKDHPCHNKHRKSGVYGEDKQLQQRINSHAANTTWKKKSKHSHDRHHGHSWHRASDRR